MILNRFASLLICSYFAIGCAHYFMRTIDVNDFHRFARNFHYRTFTTSRPGPLKTKYLEPGNGIRDSKHKWPRVGNKIAIPFVIDSHSSFSRHQKSTIYAAMKHISDRTCIHFQWRSTEKDYLMIRSGNWCTSFVGRVGGAQMLSLQKDSSCGNDFGAIIHELVHAVGFHHMQSHANRDQFISVMNENIVPGERYQFDKVSPADATNYGTPYDYMSIMHYGTHAFSRNGRPTIVAKSGKYNQLIGQTNKLSSGDVTRIRMMYNCKCLDAGYRMC